MLDRVVEVRFPKDCKAPGTKLRVDNGPAYKARAFLEHAAALWMMNSTLPKGWRFGNCASACGGLTSSYLRHGRIFVFEV
jgi:hypothetical protein